MTDYVARGTRTGRAKRPAGPCGDTGREQLSGPERGRVVTAVNYAK